MQLIAVCFIAFLAVVVGQSEPEFVQGVPGDNDGGLLTREAETETRAEAAAPKCETGKPGPKCTACSKLMYCDGKAEEPLTVNACSDDSPEEPYCVKGQCQKDPDPDDAECKKAGDITCTFEGYMPDPGNCAKYYYCKAKGDDPKPYNCPPQYAYNHNSTMCKLIKSEKDCVKLQCAPGKNFVVYQPDQSIYGVCDSKTNKTTVFRCKDEKNQWFIEKSKQCKLICRKQGPFADRTDDKCQKYHMCYVQNNKWKIQDQECPEGLVFDTEELKCAKAKEGAKCEAIKDE